MSMSMPDPNVAVPANTPNAISIPEDRAEENAYGEIEVDEEDPDWENWDSSETKYDWDVVLEYAKDSTWFGTCFLMCLLGRVRKVPLAKEAENKRFAKLRQRYRTARDDRQLTIYAVVDMFLLFGATALQPILYSFFLWAILTSLKGLDEQVGSLMCPANVSNWNFEQDGPWVQHAAPVENCFYFALLTVYLFQMLAEVQNAVDFLKRLRWSAAQMDQLIEQEKLDQEQDAAAAAHATPRALGPEGEMLNVGNNVPAGGARQEKMHQVEEDADAIDEMLEQEVYLRKGVCLLGHRFTWAIVFDQVLHVLGICILTVSSMLAMYFQNGVGQMVLNATAVYFLEQVDDMLKASSVRRQAIRLKLSMRAVVRDDLEKYIHAEKVLKAQQNGGKKLTNEEKKAEKDLMNKWKQDRNHVPRRLIIVACITVAACLAVTGFTIFLAVQTGRGCKPNNTADIFKLFE